MGSAVYIVIAVIFLSLLESEFNFIHLLFETSSAFATVGISVGDGEIFRFVLYLAIQAKLLLLL